jgi:hypothetical protein
MFLCAAECCLVTHTHTQEMFHTFASFGENVLYISITCCTTLLVMWVLNYGKLIEHTRENVLNSKVICLPCRNQIITSCHLMKDCTACTYCRYCTEVTVVLMQVLQGSQHCLALKGVNSKSNDINIFSVSFLSISLVGFLLTLLPSLEFQFF